MIFVALLMALVYAVAYVATITVSQRRHRPVHAVRAAPHESASPSTAVR